MKNMMVPRMIILAALRHGPATATELLERIDSLTQNSQRMTHGVLYPTLTRLGATKKVTETAFKLEGKHPTTRYALTAAGLSETEAIYKMVAALFGKVGGKVKRGASKPAKKANGKKANGKAARPRKAAKARRGGKKGSRANPIQQANGGESPRGAPTMFSGPPAETD